MTESYKLTTLLRFNRGMIRDAWIELDKDNKSVLVIRQSKFNQDNSEATIKCIRLVDDEIDILLKLINKLGI